MDTHIHEYANHHWTLKSLSIAYLEGFHILQNSVYQMPTRDLHHFVHMGNRL